MKISQIILSFCLAWILVLSCATQAIAFCGFYVGGADAKLFNKASQVVIARNGDRTILTMVNDFQGAIEDFAMVIPVPVAIKREQVNIGKRTAIDKLDAFSQPRLVEYTEIPEYVKSEFGSFYKATFQKVYEREQKKVAFLEYAWDTGNCDPCSTEPPSPAELKAAGVFWLDDGNSPSGNIPGSFRRQPRQSNTFITRLHVRYTRDKFPEDLMFQETGNQENFQGRYVMNHPFKGAVNCDAGKKYQQTLRPRLEKEASNLANLTGWSIRDINSKIDLSFIKAKPETNTPFWQNIWPSK